MLYEFGYVFLFIIPATWHMSQDTGHSHETVEVDPSDKCLCSLGITGFGLDALTAT